MSGFYLANTTLIQNCLIAILLALSIQVVMRIGVLSVAGIGFYGISSYVAGNLVKFDIVSPELAIVLAVLLCGLLSYLLAFLLRRVSGLYLAMVTLAFVLILNVAATNGGSFTGGANGLYGLPFAIDTVHIAVVTALGLGVVILTQHGRLGRASEALRSDPLLATSMGISVNRYRAWNLVLSGMLGGAAGALNVLNLGAVGPFDAGFALAVGALTMVIVGGRRSWLGAVIGATIITLLPTLFSVFEGELRNVAIGLIVVIMATFAPDGLVGIGESVIKKVRRRPAGGEPSSIRTGKRGRVDAYANHD